MLFRLSIVLQIFIRLISTSLTRLTSLKVVVFATLSDHSRVWQCHIVREVFQEASFIMIMEKSWLVPEHFTWLGSLVLPCKFASFTSKKPLAYTEATAVLDWRVAFHIQLRVSSGRFNFIGVYNDLAITSQKSGNMDEQVLPMLRKRCIKRYTIRAFFIKLWNDGQTRKNLQKLMLHRAHVDLVKVWTDLSESGWGKYSS